MIDTSGRVIFAVLDTADNCWIGNGDGPLTYTDFALARIAAQVLETRVFGTDLAGRYRAVECQAGALRLKDKVDAKMSGIAALEHIENAPTESPREYVDASYNHGWSERTRKVQ